MSEKKGIKDLMEVLDFGFELSSKGKAMFQNGFDANQLVAIMGLYPKAALAIDGFENVIPEIKDLDETEAAEVIGFVVSKGVASEEAGRIAHKSIVVAIKAYELYKEIKD